MKKFLVGTATLILSLLFLSACSSVTLDDAKSTSNSVIEVRTNGVFEQSTYGYYTASGELEEFEKCQTQIFSKTVCKTEDGVREFSFNTRKSKIRNASIKVDGLEISLDCVRPSLGENRICLPR